MLNPTVFSRATSQPPWPPPFLSFAAEGRGDGGGNHGADGEGTNLLYGQRASLEVELFLGVLGLFAFFFC